jgi:ketosteroid isomerase-like protein
VRAIASFWLVALILVAGQTESENSRALQELVDAERAFAAAAQTRGWRAAFIEYFAGDAVAFTPSPAPMQPRLRSQPNRPASQEELSWEPRVGDVAASGDLGWLTGPSTFVDHTTEGFVPQHGNYFSIWKRQPDGQWRVLIDIGTKTPEEVPFAPGFVRASTGSRPAANTDAASAASTVRNADRALNDAIARSGAASAYARVTTSTTRLHRNGTETLPAIGTDAIGKWLDAHTPRFTAVAGSGEASRAGDLAFTYGTYQLPGDSAGGAYVRMWERRDRDTWMLQIDAIVPTN